MYNPTIKLRLTFGDKVDIADTLIKEGLAEDALNNLVKDTMLAKIIRGKLNKPLKIKETPAWERLID